jgi:hypothetical protein
MPRSIGVGRRHKRGTGNSKLTPHKRKIQQSNKVVERISKQPKVNHFESSPRITSSISNNSSIVDLHFPTVTAMAQKWPKKFVTPPSPPTADATTSLVVEFYKENFHSIVTSIRSARKMILRNKSAMTTTTKNSA